jgi:hypothetical protein
MADIEKLRELQERVRAAKGVWWADREIDAAIAIFDPRTGAGRAELRKLREKAISTANAASEWAGDRAVLAAVGAYNGACRTALPLALDYIDKLESALRHALTALTVTDGAYKAPPGQVVPATLSCFDNSAIIAEIQSALEAVA